MFAAVVTFGIRRFLSASKTNEKFRSYFNSSETERERETLRPLEITHTPSQSRCEPTNVWYYEDNNIFPTERAHRWAKNSCHQARPSA